MAHIDAATAGTLRDRFLADHRRLEKVFERLLEASESDDRDELMRLYGDLESGLVAHMDAEEQQILPAFARVEPAMAEELSADHRRFRIWLSELRGAVEAPQPRLDHARAFIEELRAHARKENALLYRFADEHLHTEEFIDPMAPRA